MSNLIYPLTFSEIVPPPSHLRVLLRHTRRSTPLRSQLECTPNPAPWSSSPARGRASACPLRIGAVLDKSLRFPRRLFASDKM